MKKTFRLLVLVLLVAGWTLAALSLHVVVAPGSPGRIIVVPKNQLGVKETYVDTRHWTLGDVSNHPAVTQRLIQTGKSAALAQLAQSGEDLTSVLNDAIAKGPQPAAPTTRPSSDAHQSQARTHK